MIIELIEEAREWLVEAAKIDENWWAEKGEGQGICLSINLESAAKRLEGYDAEWYTEEIQTMRKLQVEVEKILWG